MFLTDFGNHKHTEFQKVRNTLNTLQEIIRYLPEKSAPIDGFFIDYTDVSPNTGFADASVSFTASDRNNALRLINRFPLVALFLNSVQEHPFQPARGEIPTEGTEIFPVRLVIEPNGNRIYLNWFAFQRESNHLLEVNCYLPNESIGYWNQTTETCFEDFPAEARIIRQGEGMFEHFVAYWNLPVDDFGKIFLKKTMAKCYI